MNDRTCKTCKYEQIDRHDLPCRKCYCKLLGIPVEPTHWEKKEETKE